MYVPEAEELYRKAMDISLRVVGRSTWETLTNRAGLGMLFAFQNRHDEAERELRETLSIARRVLGPEDAFTLNVAGQLSQALLSAQRYPEAESVAREFVAGRLKVLGPEHPMTLVAVRRFWHGTSSVSETLQGGGRAEPAHARDPAAWQPGM